MHYILTTIMVTIMVIFAVTVNHHNSMFLTDIKSYDQYTEIGKLVEFNGGRARIGQRASGTRQEIIKKT